MATSQLISNSDIAFSLKALRTNNPLVHCITNEVVQEITANVLLAAGASPAMVVGEGETEQFVEIASALSINVGTPFTTRIHIMKIAASKARQTGTPWVLDPVAAGGMVWRDQVIFSLMHLCPAAIRGNASEIRFLAGEGQGGKGVDSTDKSDEAVHAAMKLAKLYNTIVVVTGEKDYITDGTTTLHTTGGDPLITKVVGTGCSLSSLLAAFICLPGDKLRLAASCCAYVKKATEIAKKQCNGPGTFKPFYLDALYNLNPEDFHD